MDSLRNLRLISLKITCSPFGHMPGNDFFQVMAALQNESATPNGELLESTCHVSTTG